MSNLGDYEKIVKLIKMVGGPARAKALTAVAASGLVVAGGYLHKGIQNAGPLVRNWTGSLKRSDEPSGPSYTVHTSATDGQGLEFTVDDVFRILERDDDSVLIEIIGRDDNPWVVSAGFLEQISEFAGPDHSSNEGF